MDTLHPIYCVSLRARAHHRHTHIRIPWRIIFKENRDFFVTHSPHLFFFFCFGSFRKIFFLQVDLLPSRDIDFARFASMQLAPDTEMPDTRRRKMRRTDPGELCFVLYTIAKRVSGPKTISSWIKARYRSAIAPSRTYGSSRDVFSSLRSREK